MRIIVDADACPVKRIVEELAVSYKVELIMVSNYHHVIASTYATLVVVDAASQSADMTIANYAHSGDIVVTQDYGLASMVLGKRAGAIHPSGKIYTADNIDGLLMQRYVNQKARLARKRIANPKKRQTEDDQRFRHNLEKMILEGQEIADNTLH